MPMEFDTTALDAIENSGAVQFGNETIVTRSLAKVVGDVNAGQRREKARFNNSDYVNRLNECVKFVEGVKAGEVSQDYLREGFSTSDLPILFGDILDMRLLGCYNPTTPT